jgi:two-component system OmpR family sensor kinase
LKLEALEVGAEIDRAAELFGGRGQASAVSGLGAEATAIHVDIEDGLPPARGDLQRFRQILRNLLDNAVEHGYGQVVVAARGMERPPPSVSAPPPPPAEAGYVAVTVADSGPGIAPEHAANLFERFYRTDPSRRRATGGAGLGLAIVRQLVQAQGGCVWVESAPGKGSVFGFCLPVDTQRRQMVDD